MKEQTKNYYFKLYERFKEEKKKVPIGSIWEHSSNTFANGHLHITSHSIINIMNFPTLFIEYDIRHFIDGSPVRSGYKNSAKSLLISDWKMILP
jgi:hypothetical protein